MSTIDDLKAKVQRLTDQLRDATASLREAEKAASPFTPGDIVRRKYRGELKEYRVLRLSHRYGRLSVVANERRKHGGWMDRETEIAWFDELTKIGHETAKA